MTHEKIFSKLCLYIFIEARLESNNSTSPCLPAVFRSILYKYFCNIYFRIVFYFDNNRNCQWAGYRFVTVNLLCTRC